MKENLINLKQSATELTLRNLFRRHGIDTSTWGTGNAKTLHHLATELASGECKVFLIDGEVHRTVEVVRVFVTYEDGDIRLQLIEDRQEFHDGRVRRRGNDGISEKIMPGEDIEDAAKRALAEELGIDTDVDVQYTGSQTLEHESMSYLAFNPH